MQIIPKVLFVGIGLIGGSFALALRKAGLVEEIMAIDCAQDNLIKAVETKVIDRAASWQDAKDADVIIIATPVAAVKSVLEKIAEIELKDSVLITDVASVKAEVFLAAEQVFGKVPANLVPAHPLAGLEKFGVEAARADLFQDRLLIITTHENTDIKYLDKLLYIWQAIGARCEIMSAQTHDAILAATSHLPHILAFLLVDMLGHDLPDNYNVFSYTASGFRDFSRIAASSPHVWRDIALSNSQEILNILEIYQRRISEFMALLQTKSKSDIEEIEQILTRAGDLRRNLTYKEAKNESL